MYIYIVPGHGGRSLEGTGFMELAQDTLQRMALLLKSAEAGRAHCAPLRRDLLLELLALVVEKREDRAKHLGNEDL